MVAFERTILTVAIILAVAAQNVHAGDDDEEYDEVDAEQDEEFGMNFEEVCDALKTFAENCTSQPERIHIEELVLNKEDAEPGTKSLRYCLLAQFALVDEGQNVMNHAKTSEMMEMVFHDKEKEVKEVMTMCNKADAATPDKYDSIHNINMCMLREMKTRGMKMPEMKQ